MRIAEKSNKDRRGWRIGVFNETKKIAAAGMYQKADGSTAVLPRTPTDRSQQVASADELPQPTATYEDCKVVVYEGDCIDAARHYSLAGMSVAVLNMASDKKPGGGVQSGSGAQEENLFRRSNYFQHLYNRDVVRYPMSETAGIYSPGVVFFREAEAEDYRVMDSPVVLDMVAVPAMRRPQLVKQGTDLWISHQEMQLVYSKIRTMLKLASTPAHEVLILSAWGCGAFCNPPLCIATAFKTMLDGEFRDRFKRVVFAIFDDQNARKAHNPQGNVEPFERVFGTSVVRRVEDLS